MTENYDDLMSNTRKILDKILTVAPELTRDEIEREFSLLNMSRFSSKPYTPKHSPFLDDLWHELLASIELIVRHPQSRLLYQNNSVEMFDSIFGHLPDRWNI